jgi:hypothetical protein
MSKFKIGDKVVPMSKLTGLPLIDSSAWNNAKNLKQPYLVVMRIPINKYDVYTCDVIPSGAGDFFLESDLIPYEEFQAQIEPKEKPPVWYTLPAPETENIEPNYKGFYEFMKTHGADVFCDACPCQKDFCRKHVEESCTEVLTLYAENKFIKGNK